MEELYAAGNLPDSPENLSYVVAKNGAFVIKETNMFRACARIEEIPERVFPEQKSHCTIKFPKLPYSIIGQSLAFFRQVFKDHAGEAMLLLTYDQEKGWGLLPPTTQDVTGGTVSYEIEGIPDAPVAGTIHSHCNMDAFFSGTDDQDDLGGSEGVHIVLGKIDSDCPEIVMGCVVGKERFAMDPREWIEDMNPSPEKVSKDMLQYFANNVQAWLRDRGLFDLVGVSVSSEGNSITINFEEKEPWKALEYPAAWLDTVEKKVYSYGKNYGFGYPGVYSGQPSPVKHIPKTTPDLKDNEKELFPDLEDIPEEELCGSCQVPSKDMSSCACGIDFCITCKTDHVQDCPYYSDEYVARAELTDDLYDWGEHYAPASPR